MMEYNWRTCIKGMCQETAAKQSSETSSFPHSVANSTLTFTLTLYLLSTIDQKFA
jgi:hypothetical protein